MLAKCQQMRRGKSSYENICQTLACGKQYSYYIRLSQIHSDLFFDGWILIYIFLAPAKEISCLAVDIYFLATAYQIWRESRDNRRLFFAISSFPLHIWLTFGNTWDNRSGQFFRVLEWYWTQWEDMEKTWKRYDPDEQSTDLYGKGLGKYGQKYTPAWQKYRRAMAKHGKLSQIYGRNSPFIGRTWENMTES